MIIGDNSPLLNTIRHFILKRTQQHIQRDDERLFLVIEWCLTHRLIARERHSLDNMF